MSSEQTKPDVLTRELWHVAGTGDVARLEQILAQGADVNASDRTGVTALMRAAYHGELPMVRALIEHGVDLDAKDSGGLTALMMAKHSGRAEIVEALMSSGAKENPKRRVHKTLPVEPELEEVPAAVTHELSPARTLHDPPEIWELVHTTQDSASETVSASRYASARILILAACVLIVGGGAVSGVFVLWKSASANDATARRDSTASESAKTSTAPASSVKPPAQTLQNSTSAEPPKAAPKPNQTISLKPAGETTGIRDSQPATPQSAQVAMPVKKSSAKSTEPGAVKSRVDVDMRVLRSGRYESLQQPAVRVRGSNNDKSANATNSKSEATKTPSPQATGAPKTNVPKPKVIQWP